MSENLKLYRPQAGAQSMFLSTDADIAIYGGAAGGGKSYAVLLECGSTAAGIVSRAEEAKRQMKINPNAFEGKKMPTAEFHAVIFRRQSTDLRNSGSLLNESKKMYYSFNATLKDQPMLWEFAQNVDVKFAGLPYDSSVNDWHGAQLDLLVFDELTHFTEYQFWYLMSRMRSSSGNVRPYLRATCNPEPNWVLDLIEWWIGKDGYAIPERSGVIRWFIRLNGVVHWFDSRQDAMMFRETNCLPKELIPRSFTFIPSTIEDNPAMLKNNPDYVSTLHSLPDIEKQRLLMGNWRIQPSGKLFKIENFQNFIIPPNFSKKILVIDSAQETKTANDYTVCQSWGKFENKCYFVGQFRGKVEILEQVDIVVNMAINENVNAIYIEKKANGSPLIQSVRRMLAKMGIAIPVIAIDRSIDKYTRGLGCQAYIDGGFVFINKHADYYVDFCAEVAQFAPELIGKSRLHDDQVDCMMDAIEILLRNPERSDNIQNSNSANRNLKLNIKKKQFSGY